MPTQKDFLISAWAPPLKYYDKEECNSQPGHCRSHLMDDLCLEGTPNADTKGWNTRIFSLVLHYLGAPHLKYYDKEECNSQPGHRRSHLMVHL